jgi:hypothetical protein
VVYTVSDEEIVIAACIHGSRDPQRWKKRL